MKRAIGKYEVEFLEGMDNPVTLDALLGKQKIGEWIDKLTDTLLKLGIRKMEFKGKIVEE